MKKIGLLTYYYNTTNYGGMLQAFALCKAINTFGEEYRAEQICYDYNSAINEKKTFFKVLKRFTKQILSSFVRKYRKNDMSEKARAFKAFEKVIPHSSIVFSNKNISDANPYYDIFIVGSDQVWNPITLDDCFFLEFAETSKLKISYAASLGADDIDKSKLDVIRKKIMKFDWISVREKSSIKLLGNIDKRIIRTIDPVFLLDKNEWINELETTEIEEKVYVLTYFLSNDITARKKAEEYAEKKELPIVDFSPIQLYRKNFKNASNVGPLYFVKYIKNAKACFTDSFHCTAFCIMFNVDFYSFTRQSQVNITANNRIVNLLSELGLTDHLADINGDVIHNAMNSNKIGKRICRFRKEGLDFLLQAINDELERSDV